MERSDTARRAASVTLGLAFVFAALAGCQSAGYEARFELQVSEAVIEENAPEDGPDTQEVAISVSWSATTGGLDAHFANPADSTAAILWEGATFSYESGEPEPLVATAPHAGPDLPQSPTAIPRNGQMVIGMLPASHAEWEWLPNRAMGGSWVAPTGLFGVTLTPEQTESERLSLAEAVVGRRAKIEIPIQTGSRVITYIYDVRVTGAEVYASYH